MMEYHHHLHLLIHIHVWLGKFDLKSFTATTTNNKNVEDENPTAVMAVFAGDDILPGATREDAAMLNDVLGKNDAVKDHLVKVRCF